MRLRIFLLLLFACVVHAFGQKIKVQGTVTDEKGEALIGVTVHVQGNKKNGTVTDFDGNFIIRAKKNDKLVFKYVGMKTKTVVVNGKRTLQVVMKDDVNALDEVVVVGYGVQKKVDLTGSIAAVRSDELESTTSIDITNSLTGRVVGARIAQYSSTPGDYDTDIDIRGFGLPLIIIDGVERSQAEFARLTSDEIEDLSVLKDGSAAVYGVKAANGVILVTTKQGKTGKARIKYSGKFGLIKMTSFPDMCNAAQYAELHNERFYNDQLARGVFDGMPRFTQEEIEQFRTGNRPSYNYLDMVMKDQTTQQTHSVTISGGAQKTNYFIMGSYFKQNGLFESNDLHAKKYNFRANLQSELRKGLKLGVNLGYVNSEKRGLNNSMFTVFKSAFRQDPIEQPFANGNPDYYAFLPYGAKNPLALADADLTGYEKITDKFIQSKFELQYIVPFVKGLNLRAMYSHDDANRHQKNFSKSYDLYTYDTGTEEYNRHTFGKNSVRIYDNIDTKDTYQFAATYNTKLFKKHKIDLLALYEATDKKSEGTWASSELALSNIDELNAGKPSTDDVYSRYKEYSSQSLVGRVNYNYDDRYLFETSFRYDGSSKFPKDGRWGFFPSVSGAWRISQEPFFKKRFKMVDNLKIRGSWARMGDDRAANGEFISGYIYTRDNQPVQMGNDWVQTVTLQDVVNPDITWYTSETVNVGIDLNMWDQKLTASFDIFNRKREDLLAYESVTVPSYMGVKLPQKNLNSDRTSGYEIHLGHSNKIGALRYSIQTNFSYTRTKRLHTEESPNINAYKQYRNGKSYRYNDIVWGYKSDGQFQTYEEIRTAPIIDGAGNRKILPGDVRFKDLNEDGVINDKDKVPIGIGGNKPKYYYGISTRLSWKNLDFTMLWQGAFKNMVKYRDQLATPLMWGQATPVSQYYDRWHREDMTDKDSPWIPGRFPSTGNRFNYLPSDFWYFDASYIRLKNIELGYTLSKSLSRKVGINKCRVYTNAYNLITFQSGYDFVDPEFNAGRDYSYPVTYNINFGVNLEF